ncbi:MAG: tRNA (adenosine(37)-N6)-threonylcarbamoyltransferase complex transferase subunit TsaD [Ruminococcaceae bacterium]|nr:tRNA (adenosine(37)-N6)-threonylcarbamoyltransferase complex transferase subunit TsaD [Oscillospiraceae bacterium]
MVYLLGIESSCDETAAAVAAFDGERKTVLADVVASQVDIHKKYGGVVPEIASRAHTEALTRITKQALAESGIALSQLTAVAVTNTPGLIGALLTGVNFAKSLAFANALPLVPVDHIKAHIAAAYYAFPDLKPPFLALTVSGGHTSLMKVDSFTDFVTVGCTRDDAAGEAFDKVGRVMGLPYPGGKEMDRLAAIGDPHAFPFPSAAVAGDNLDFSFSGVKTAVINTLNTMSQKGIPFPTADIAASFTNTFTRSIVKKLDMAFDRYPLDTLVVSGGVAANSHLRRAVKELCDRKGIRLCMPPIALCGDNGAMVCSQGYYEYRTGKRGDTSLNAFANDEF